LLLAGILELSHAHAEREDTPGALPIRVGRDCTPVPLDYLLYNQQAESDARGVHFSGAVQLAKLLEQVGDLFAIDTDARIFHIYV